MSSKNNDSGHVVITGKVVSVDRDKFKIQVGESADNIVVAQVSGKMRKNNIRVILDDMVEVKVSPYDLSKGFITTRL